MNPNQSSQLIRQIFNQHLGRDPQDYELKGFQDAFSRGIIDPVGLGLFIQSSQEYSQRQAPGQAASYVKSLQDMPGYDVSKQLRKYQDQAVGRFAELGRPDSTGLGAQFAQVGGQMAEADRNRTWGAGADYLSRAMGAGSANQTGQYGSYGRGFSAYQGKQYDLERMQRESEYQGDYLDRAYKQAQGNQFASLGGGLLQAGGKVLEGALAGGYI